MKFFSLLVVTVVLYSGCSENQPQQPNILWISCEDISPAWGCYGDKQATTPNIDMLANQDGYVFRQAFSNAPICAPARSTLITGMYATSLGTQNLRSEIPVPKDLKVLPELLQAQGYYTSNNSKTDYNFSPEGRWNEGGGKAHWRNRPEGKPFFSVFNFGITHEGNANSDVADNTKTLAQKHKPEDMLLPPYFPETEEFKSILANQYDLITVFDQEVGKLVEQLKEDKVYDNTIIFVFSDHGYGLPRYKRWLYNTGLQVPFVLHVPEKYKDKISNLPAKDVNQMVGFVDFAPTVLELAQAETPKRMEGKNFLGKNAVSKKYIHGYRDRADDAYDMSRSVYDGRYLYIRNFMPQKPYIQNVRIFNGGKRSYEELNRLKALGELHEEANKMFMPKAPEELYDLQSDPHELNNLINDSGKTKIIADLHDKLSRHIIESNDTGLMNEGDMMLRAVDGSVYEIAQDPNLFNSEKVLQAAELAGKIKNLEELNSYFQDEDAAVRFWALNALDIFDGDIESQEKNLLTCLNDPSLPNRCYAAEILVNKFNNLDAIKTLEKALDEENEAVLLQVAISIRNIGVKARPLLSIIKNEVYPKVTGDVGKGGYKSWSYPMFIGMALDQVFINCGEEI